MKFLHNNKIDLLGLFFILGLIVGVPCGYLFRIASQQKYQNPDFLIYKAQVLGCSQAVHMDNGVDILGDSQNAALYKKWRNDELIGC